MRDRQRQHRASAIADERQGHALRRRDLDVDRHVDQRLQPELDGQPGGGEDGEADFLVEQLDQHPRDDAEVEAGDGEAGDQPELLADHREDVVGVRLGQAELARAAARPHPEQPAGGQRAHRILDLEIVALAEQEAVDADRAPRRRRNRRARPRPAPPRRAPRMTCRLRPGQRQHRDPHRAEDDGRAEVGLDHQQHRDHRRSAPPRQ